MPFDILNLSHAQRRRLRRVLEFVCYLGFVIWDFQYSEVHYFITLSEP